MLFGLIENIVSTIVGPSLIFYIESVGGNNRDYGLTTSAAYLGASLMMFYFGDWVDNNGNKYQAPLACAFILCIIGSIIYFLATILPTGFWAVNAILVGRFIQGMGSSGKVLLRSWIITAIPHEKQKAVISFLPMVQIAGQTLGPTLNTLVAEIDTTIEITSNFSIHLNPYNSIGLVVAVNEVVLWLIVALFVKDPPPMKKKSLSPETSVEATTAIEPGLYDIAKALAHFDILFPLVRRFIIVVNFNVILNGLSPVALNMLNWTPVELSALSVVTAGVSFVGMSLTLYLSLRQTSDFAMLMAGNIAFAISGLLTYLLWRVDMATAVAFATPMILVSLVQPLSSPANLSAYTKAIFSREELAGFVGRLNSLYMQFAIVPGIVVPPLVMTYVVRDPKDINLDKPHELTTWALFVPISSLLIIFGLLYEEYVLGKNEPEAIESAGVSEDEAIPDETTKLVKTKSTRSSIVEINQVFTRKYEVERRMSVEIDNNGLGLMIDNPFETATDCELMKKLSTDKEEWERLLTLDEEEMEE